MSTDPQTEASAPQAGTPLTNALRDDAARAAEGLWWIFLVTGILWLIIAMMVLRFNTTSVTTIGVLMGVIFLVAMANEFLDAFVRRSWRWAHIAMGVIFLLGSIWAFASPKNAFWTLASVIGLLLVLQGALVLVSGIASRPFNAAWWLGVFAGIVEILIGFWASQQVITARAALLIFYVGFLALFRGITEIVLAFEVRSLHEALTRPGETARQ
jgi:uncharacterized membrane protein HdeD (DUF308 family)